MKYDIDKSLIPSKTIRDYIRKNGWEFEEIEIASLICNSPGKPILDMINELKNFKESCTDKYTVKEINKRIIYEEKMLGFLTNDSDKFIFSVKLYEFENQVVDDIDTPDEVYFRDYQSSYEYGKKKHPKYGYEIIKYYLNDIYDKRIKSPYAGYLKYDKNGKLLLYCAYKDHFKCRMKMTDLAKYTEFFVLLPAPFKYGDIVYSNKYNDYGIVTNTIDWEYIKQLSVRDRIYNDIGNIRYIRDLSVSVEFIDDDGIIFHRHIWIGDLSIIDRSTICKVAETNNKLYLMYNLSQLI